MVHFDRGVFIADSTHLYFWSCFGKELQLFIGTEIVKKGQILVLICEEIVLIVFCSINWRYSGNLFNGKK